MINPIIPSICTYTNRNVSFKHNTAPLKRINIGSLPNGFVAKVKVRKGDGETFLSVFKEFLGKNAENYTIKNDKNDIIGNLNLFVIKPEPCPWIQNSVSYVFLDELRNFSKPDTPYHNKSLEYYKDIGIRLIQIAQRRSEEEGCNGNIQLISVNEAMNWYKNVIGMRQMYIPISGQPNFNNPNQLYLPPENKGALANLRGGLGF